LQDPAKNRRIRLTEKEAAILKFLYRAGSRAVQRQVLLNEVWGYNAMPSTRTVDVHVRRLREKLPPLVEGLVTVKQFGYKLVDPPPA